jgi:O-antigen/teichoic acid export membrane protein
MGMLLGSLIGLLMYCYFLRGNFKLIKPSYNLMKKLVQYSFPYYCAAWLRFSIMNADRFFVSIFFRPEQLAIYHIASKITGYVITAMDAIANPITSKIAQLQIYGRKRMESIYSKVFKYYSLLYIPLIGLMIAFARPIIELYGGIKYSEGTMILMILAAGLLLAPYSGLIETYVFILGKPVDRLKIRFFSGIFSLLGAYGLMRMFGVYGLAFSKVFVWTIYIFVGILLLRNNIQMNIDKESLLKAVTLSLPIIIAGVFIQFFLYSYLASAVCFLISASMLVLFYVIVVRRERIFL